MADTAEQRQLVGFEPHAWAPPVAEAAASELVGDVVEGDRKPRRKAFDDHDERGPVRLTRRQESQHRTDRTGGPGWRPQTVRRLLKRARPCERRSRQAEERPHAACVAGERSYTM